MPNPPEPPDPWSLRASDADRDKYLALLREAYAEGRLDAAEYDERVTAALHAKTFGELYPVLTDLPIDPARIPAPPIIAGAALGQHYLPVATPGPTAGNYPAGRQADDSIVSILGSTSRKGAWLVPAQVQVLALLGDATLDLTNAVLSGMTTELRCNAVLGSVKVIVPDALHLDVSGTGILGEFESKDKRKGADQRRTPAPNAPQVRITGVAIFGSVEVRVVVPKGKRAGVSMLNPQLPPGPMPPEIGPSPTQ